MAAPRDSETLTERDIDTPQGAATPFPQPPVQPAAPQARQPVEQPGGEPAPMPTTRAPVRGLAVPPGDFVMVAADEDLQPIGEPQPQPQRQGPQRDRAPVQEPPREDRLSEQEVADQPLLDQQRQQQQQRPGRWTLRRQSQRAARMAQTAENEQLRAQLQETQDQLAQLAPRVDQMTAQQRANELANVNRAVQDHQRGYKDAQQRLSAAFAGQDADAFAKAMEDRDVHLYEGQRAINRQQQLQGPAPAPAPVRDGGQVAQPQRQIAPQPQPRGEMVPPPMAPEAADFAEQFLERYPWARSAGVPDFDPYDFETVRALDTAVSNLGYDPRQPDYWEELERQMQARLPHRFQDGQLPQQQQQRAPARQTQQRRQVATPQERRGPMTAAATDGAPRGAGGQTRVYISGERKTALIAAGALDGDGTTITNEPKFKRLLAQYNEFDRANGVGQYARRTG